MKEFDEIIEQANMPEPPTEYYTKALQQLDEEVRRAIALSQQCAGLPSTSTRHYYASVLFTTIVARSITLMQIAPLSNWAEKIIEHWDYASTSVIARTVMEIRLCFHYLCVEQCSDAEWQCRWETMNIHDCTHRIKIFQATDSAEQVVLFQQELDKLAARISANSHFQLLDRKKQKDVLRGAAAYLKPLEEIAEKIGISKAHYRFFQTFFSTHVHGFPMSFFRVGEDRGRGLPTEAESGYTAICLDLVASLISSCSAEFEGLFEDSSNFRSSHCELKAGSTPDNPDNPAASSLAIDIAPGEIRSVLSSESMRIEAVGLLNNEVSLLYLEALTGEKVLRVQVNSDGDYRIAFIDPVYWSIEINNSPSTDRLLDELMRGEYAYSVDLSSRKICIKVPTEALQQAREALSDRIKIEPMIPNVSSIAIQ